MRSSHGRKGSNWSPRDDPRRRRARRSSSGCWSRRKWADCGRHSLRGGRFRRSGVIPGKRRRTFSKIQQSRNRFHFLFGLYPNIARERRFRARMFHSPGWAAEIPLVQGRCGGFRVEPAQGSGSHKKKNIMSNFFSTLYEKKIIVR